jgi:hypothetical protein
LFLLKQVFLLKQKQSQHLLKQKYAKHSFLSVALFLLKQKHADKSLACFCLSKNSTPSKSRVSKAPVTKDFLERTCSGS